MKKTGFFASTFFAVVVFAAVACTSTPRAGKPEPARAQAGSGEPDWVRNLHEVYPDSQWIAVMGEGTSQKEAESNAMNALARAFKTDIASISQASMRMSQLVNDTLGKNSVYFEENKNFEQDVNTNSYVRGLIGVQVDMYRSLNTIYISARMNRRECAARYRATVQENVAVINRLLAAGNAAPPGRIETYAWFSFAHAIAQVTDNFQGILEVLDPAAVNRRPGYGGANAIKTRMSDYAGPITIGISINAEVAVEKTLLTRAAGSFFRGRGFKINEQGVGNYELQANIRFEELRQEVISCRYYLDAVIENQNRAALFSFTEDDRKAHINNASEARRLAVRAVETSFKEGKFAMEFDKWLNKLLD